MGVHDSRKGRDREMDPPAEVIGDDDACDHEYHAQRIPDGLATELLGDHEGR